MKQIVFVLNIALLLTISSCNTIEGVGKDVESAGSAIKESAQKNK
ncbi:MULTISPECIES: entericidin A/B family lipoprotein [Prosthecochloris]|uniref:Entericidin EcnAB n=1 Tax=Prosthecochloris marina TaxID=2017681 RepID=A0A317T328_9CHLB|nr:MULTISPECIES: entericidin A/B family lipoprotein [Prosthecochloris]PWW81102.1 Entericidin EcnAB [Prosthecochloris marina]UZJ37697.1 entericidin A/B family lipoprotein [Prosthecochloris sp. SCSIO W1103]UZJ39516.1 entericidin A/B family lipoprotein [Prosthecochloris sp. SCSIO W1102]UZJ41511.1 entericidin A/B family lipoprotein [Prosthecochloris sp. SCSIO W1101]